MIYQNPYFKLLKEDCLFETISSKKLAYEKIHPHEKVISLGMGDTSYPIPKAIAQGMADCAMSFASPKGYQGYGSYKGLLTLREKINQKLLHQHLSAKEIFISDGVKCDIGRLQMLFGSKVRIGVFDPTYPVYVSTSVLIGQAGPINPKQQYENITYLPCLEDQYFFTQLEHLEANFDVLYLCNPNNPIGIAYNRTQLKKLVDFAKEHQIVIVYDGAYASYIRDASIPSTIYEIEGAKEGAIELGSFSKMAGFSGLRLGWTCIPTTLLFQNGNSILEAFEQLYASFCNGTSLIIQHGGLVALEQDNLSRLRTIQDTYLYQTQLLKQTFEEKDYTVYGGKHAPYLWVKCHNSSWESFESLLHQCQIISIPGSGFGLAGEGFIRISGFGSLEIIEEAVLRLHKLENSNL